MSFKLSDKQRELLSAAAEREDRLLPSQLKGGAAQKDRVVSASSSPDGTHVVTASDDRTARVWPVIPDVNELIRQVRAGLTRCLSQAQRDAYGLSTEHPAEDRTFIPPPTADGRCPS